MKNSFRLVIHRAKNTVVLSGIALLAFASAATLVAHADSANAARGGNSLKYSGAWRSTEAPPALAAFSSWTEQYAGTTDETVRSNLLPQGVVLARQRRAALLEMIQADPEKALASAVPAAVAGNLPAEIRAEVETRVSGMGDLSVLIFCPAPGGAPVESIQRNVSVNGQTYQAYVYGRRASQTSRRGIPLNGIALGGVLALHEGAIRELEKNEVVAPGKTVSDVPASTANPAGGEPVIAEMGGEYYRFASAVHLHEVEGALEAAESGVSPFPTRPAASVLQSPGQSSNGSTSANPPSAWTSGLKRILYIRVDFSDFPGDPTFPGGPAGTAAFLQNLADTQVSPFYVKSSYGLTSLTNIVTSQLYRMPQTAASYATSGNNNGLHNDAEALAAANYTLSSYDRIVVVFSFLGQIAGSSINYGGLAELTGPRVWINGEFDFRVVAHELGHTYGLYHAGLWQVTDGNPLSSGGTTIEYGDDFDTMGANFANVQTADFNPYFKNIQTLPKSRLPIKYP